MRSTSTARPTIATTRPCLRASFANIRSTRENHADPSRGTTNAAAARIAVRQPSISPNEAVVLP